MSLPDKLLNGTLIVFNFDCTLITKHLYYFLHELENINFDSKFGPIPLDIKALRNDFKNNNITPTVKTHMINHFFGGNERIRKLKEFLTDLKKNGSYIIIASFSFEGDILKLLNKVGLGDFFDEIYGRHNLLLNSKLGKIGLLYNFISNKQYKNLFYFDYDSRDHSALKYKFPDVKHIDTSYFTTAKLNHVNYHYFNKLHINSEGLQIEDLDLISEYIYKQSMLVKLHVVPIEKCKKYSTAEQSHSSWVNKYLKYKQKYLELYK